MITLAEKVKSVEAIFQSLDVEIAGFQHWSGLHCAPGCGKCCFKPDINATALEFLPLAYHYFKAGKAEALYEHVQQAADGLCIILDAGRTTGMCSDYHHRGMICRLFGYSARINKYGTPEIITCKIIKTEQEPAYQQAMTALDTKERSAPISANYYTQLMVLDEELGKTLYPINVAIKKALETVMHYYAYRDVNED